MDDPPPLSSNPPVDDPHTPYNVQAHHPPSDIVPNGDNYVMTHRRRGVAVIFNQQRYDPSMYMLELVGSEADAQSVSEAFSRLGFDVEVHVDSSLQFLKDILDDLRRRDHSDCDCFALIFITRGVDGRLACRDQLFDHNLLWDMFTPEHCPSLAYRPKLFFIDSSEGHEKIKAIFVGGSEVEVPPERSRVQLLPSYSLPDQPHFLISLATTPGCRAWRLLDRSVYIQSLCTHLARFGFYMDLMSLLTNVARSVAMIFADGAFDEEGYAITQLPSFISFLTRGLKFTDKNTSCKKTNSELNMDDDEERDVEKSMKRFCADEERSTSTQY